MKTALLAILALIAPLQSIGDGPAAPWKPQYKIKPGETARLTAADVIGPDGIVYPDWSRCGLEKELSFSGLPSFKVEDFGARANDGADDSKAILAAILKAEEAGGGSVVFPEGVFHLDFPVAVRASRIAVRGAGMERTKIVFRYAVKKESPQLVCSRTGGAMGPSDTLELRCDPEGLSKMSVSCEGKALKAWEPSKHSGNTFTMALKWSDIYPKTGKGAKKFQGQAQYKDGSVHSVEAELALSPEATDDTCHSFSRAAIGFISKWRDGSRVHLSADAVRGGMELRVKDASGLKKGDKLYIEAPASQRWNKLVKNVCKWGSYRANECRIEETDGNALRVAEPLRMDFPVEDGAFVQKTVPIEDCLIEGLTIEQTENLWITAVLFESAWNCAARDVKVVKCGRFPVYGQRAKHCEIKGCVFEDAWFKGGGGTAYAGWERCWDCLMEGVKACKLRHGPLFQWSASGNVIRNSEFVDSDGQWHSGWTNENLMERCKIFSLTRANGGYGYGLWASPPEDDAHGPNGPRNVVYNCQVESLRDGLWLGGMNESWLILYNSFKVEKGPGVFLKTSSFDHIIKGNLFILEDQSSPMLRVKTPDCVGLEVLDNVLAGGKGVFVEGESPGAVVEGNRKEPQGASPQKPKPPAESIFEWQRSHRKPDAEKAAPLK